MSPLYTALPPTAGGLLLPEEILLIRQKATRTVCPVLAPLGGSVVVVQTHCCYVVIYLKTATWMSLG